jgi:hypothetical protein
VTVHLPGGALSVTVEDGRARVVGPAVHLVTAETDI